MADFSRIANRLCSRSFNKFLLMAEFASAIVALAGAGAKVGGSLYTLIHTLKDAPSEFLALSDEIADFRSMLSRLLDAATSEDVLAIGGRQANDLDLMRLRGEQIVTEIEALVAKVRKEGQGREENSEVKKIRWLRHISQAEKLRERRSSARNGLRISQLETKLDAAVQRHTLLAESHLEMFVEVKDLLEYSSNRIRSEQSQQTATQSGKASSDIDKVMNQSRLPLKQRAARNSVALQCLEDCPCQCHFRTIVRSPRFMTEWLGDLFLGCASLPWCFSGLVTCSEQTCRRSWQPASDIQYFLPRWTSRVVGSFSVTFTMRHPPIHVYVRTRCTIPYDSGILVCAQKGDVDGARKLILSGQASVNDVDPYGLGLLYYAAYYGWRASGRDLAVKMCRFLLDLGASRDWDDEIGNTPKETMIDNTLMSLAMTHSEVDIRETNDFVDISQLFGETIAGLIEHFVEDRGLSVLHQVLLGIDRSHGTLDEYLMGLGQCPLPPEMIDAPDSRGRSALTWAVEYMWHDAARTLLKYGADPHQSRPSFRGSLPLLHLVIACPVMQGADQLLVDTVRALLQHGADVNSLDHEGWTPLHVAASWNNAAVIKELALFANGTLAWDAITADNQSTMDLALGAGYDAEVQDILRRRGDVDSEAEEFFDCAE